MCVCCVLFFVVVHFNLMNSGFMLYQWEGGQVVDLGWTTAENLVCVLKDGSMIVYDINGQLFYSRIIQRVSMI